MPEVLLNEATAIDAPVAEGGIMTVADNMTNRWVCVSQIDALPVIDTGNSADLKHSFYLDKVRDGRYTVTYRFRVTLNRLAMEQNGRQYALGDLLLQPSVIIHNGFPK